MQKALHFIFLAVLFFTQVTGAQSLSCEGVFTDIRRSSFNLTNEAIGDSKEPAYIPVGTIHALKKSRSQNQCQTSECYLFSYVGMLEVANMNILGRTNAPKISAPYLFAKKMLEWSTQRAWDPEGRTSHHFKGGFFYDSIDLTRKHGLVPEESWQPKIAFDQWDFAQLYHDINKVATKKHNKIQGNIFTNAFRRDLKTLREKRYFEALPYLKETIEKWTGPLPTSVDFRGQTLQVKDIERAYGIDHRTRIEMLYPRERFTYDTTQLQTGFKNSVEAYGGEWVLKPESFNGIEQKIVNWVQQGAPVMTELYWGKSSAHAMIIVGYEAQNGVITRWKLQNSWGEKWSDEGSAWYTVEDFRKNLRGAYFVGWDRLTSK